MPSTESVERPSGTPVGITSAATTNATSVKTSPGNVYGLSICNPSAAIKYVKFYDKASAPTVGSDTPKYRFALSANGGCFHFSDIAGLNFAVGIAFAITGGAADADATAVAANDVFVNFRYV